MTDAAIPSDLTILMDPFSTAGERFAIVRIDDLLSPPNRISSVADSISTFARVLAGLSWCSEPVLRERLAAMGLDDAAIDGRVAGARRKMQVLTSAPTVYETITRVGYRNADGQEVAGRTDVWGGSGQRVFVMRCGVCAHEYGAYGCDIDIRRCPACQDGPAGVPTAG